MDKNLEKYKKLEKDIKYLEMRIGRNSMLIDELIWLNRKESETIRDITNILKILTKDYDGNRTRKK